MDENGRAKQRQHGGNHVNNIQNGHVKNPPPTKGRPEYIRENFARNHGTQGTATSELTQVKHYQRKEGGCGGKESLTHNSAYRQESQNYGQQIKER
ncbi:MAG: hypothetical protein ABSF10_13940, partial [Verrucomicrobiota bacterium]